MVAKRAIGYTPEEERQRVQALALVTVAYKNWDVVWARMPGFPWWPGILFLDPTSVEAAGLPLTGVAFKAPEKRDVTVVSASGKEETRTIVDRYCLVMFLDKNNWYVANMNKEVTPFTLGYAQFSKTTHKRAKTTLFKLALQRAIQLFHVSNDCTEEDLALLNAPPEEKRQRVDVFQPHGATNGHRSRAGDWDDGVEDDEDGDDASGDDDYDEDGDYEFVLPKRSTKTAPRAASRKPRKLVGDAVSSSARSGRGRSATVSKRVKREAHGDDETRDGDDTQGDVKAPRGRKKLASKAVPAAAGPASGPKRSAGPKRASGKAKARLGDGADDSAAAPSKRTKASPRQGKAPAKPRRRPKQAAAASSSSSERESSDDGDVEFIENPNLVDGSDDDGDGDSGDDGASDSDTDNMRETPAYLSTTPLSKIWTTHMDDPQAASDATASAPDGTKTLVYKQDFVWDDAVFTTYDAAAMAKREPTAPGAGANGELLQTSPVRERGLGKRQMRSVQQSQIRQSLMIGNLDPHTMVQCEAYRPVPASASSAATADTPPSRSRTASSLAPPFRVVVHPDAAFVCDLHAHLATCEIIGFLGGRWDDATKTLYIQAAFPCRSLMIDGDDGSTDVEMDPGSEIELREIIQNAELEVVGWYHSHPAFAPDPSIRDIENQTSYQQLFQRQAPPLSSHDASDSRASGRDVTEPFVGLIVGTYDTKRESPVSLFRYFHTRSEKVSGGARREIFMPYELVPTRRQFRSVVRAEASAAVAAFAMYPSVYDGLLKPRYGALRMKPSSEVADSTSDAAAAGSESFGGVDLSAAGAVVPLKLEAGGDATVSSRKRKPRVDGAAVAAATDEKPAQPVKRRRGRPRTVVADDSASRIDLTGDDDGDDSNSNDAARGASAAAPEPAAEAMDVDKDDTPAQATDVDAPSAAPATDANAVGAPSPVVVVDVDASSALGNVQPAPSGRARRPRRSATPSRIPQVPSTRTDKRPVSPTLAPDTGAIIIIDEPAATLDIAPVAPAPAPLALSSSPVAVETLAASASSSAQSSPPEDDGDATSGTPRSLTPTSGVASIADDTRTGSGGGRRRGRKPTQTQRKSNQYVMYPSSGDDSVQRAVVASQIAVYGAFGSASSVSVAGGDLDSGALASSMPSSLSQESASSRSSSSSTASSADKYVFFSADASASHGTGDGAIESNVIVLSSSDDVVVGESQSQSSIVSLSGDDTDTTKAAAAARAPDKSESTAVVKTESQHASRVVVKDERPADLAPASAVKTEPQDSRSLAVKSEPLARTCASAVPSETSRVEQPVATSTSSSSRSDDAVGTVVSAPSSGDIAATPSIDEPVKDNDVVMATERDDASRKTNTVGGGSASAPVDAAPPPVLLFGSGRAVEDIRTSLARIEPVLDAMRRAQQQAPRTQSTAPSAAATARAEPAADAVTPSDSAAAAGDLVARREAHLASLRTKYGAGIHGCAEQVITLVDYYRDFERRIDLHEPWRARVSKLRKIEASLTEYVRYVNVPVHLRSDFVQDIIAYLELSWELSRPGQ